MKISFNVIFLAKLFSGGRINEGMTDVQNPVIILVIMPANFERGLFLIGDGVILKGFNLGLLSYAFEKVVTFGAGLLMKFKKFRNYWF